MVPISFSSLLVPALLTDDAGVLTIAKGNFPRPAVLTLHTSQPGHLPKATGTLPLQMLGTGVVMRRLYVLYGIPIGFWPQLIAHFYTEKIFSDILKKTIKGVLPHDVIPGDAFVPQWHYSKRSIELTINNRNILAIGSVGKDYMNMQQSSYRDEISLANFHFVNDSGEWEKSDFKFYSGVLIEVNDFVFVPSNSQQQIDCTPDMCQHSSKLLANAVEMLDCLLSEVFFKASKAITYDDSSWLKELIPCPLCLGDKQEGKADYASGDGQEDEVNCCSKHKTVHDLSRELNVVYYFSINHCLMKIKNGQEVSCPKHGYLMMECLAPDLVCLLLCRRDLFSCSVHLSYRSFKICQTRYTPLNHLVSTMTDWRKKEVVVLGMSIRYVQGCT